MTIEEAKDIFESKNNNLMVVKIFDWDDKRFVLSAVPDKSRNDYIDPFYYVNKVDGSIGSFGPGEDFERFAKLMNR